MCTIIYTILLLAPRAESKVVSLSPPSFAFRFQGRIGRRRLQQHRRRRGVDVRGRRNGAAVRGQEESGVDFDASWKVFSGADTNEKRHWYY